MLADLITRYGYWVVLVGTFFEGETVVVIAGYAAHRGHLSLLWVVVCAFAGSLCGDQVSYALGRRFAPSVLRRRASWRPKVERARQLLERHGVAVMLGFRFLYGVRTVIPFTIGWVGVARRVFAPLNAIGAALWAAATSGLGYAFGSVLAQTVEHAQRYEEWIIVALALAGIAAWLLSRWACGRRRQRGRKHSAASG